MPDPASESPDKHDAICITGAGLATCLGLDAEAVWRRVRRGECGIGPMPALEQPLPPDKDGGQAPDLPADFLPDQPREMRYLRWTIDAALRDARIDLSTHDPSRVSLLLGTTLHGMRAGGAFLRSNDYAHLSTFLAGDTVALATQRLAIGGTRVTTCSACSSSLGAIALAVTLLETGEADLVIAGGYDTISEYVYAGFDALRLVSDPPLRPFTVGRVGMKVAEGYGIVILERLRDAESRGATPLAIVAGWGESADAYHLTKPHPEGSGALAAMRQALARAGIEPGELDLVAAHATGTPDNDLSESSALLALLGGAASRVPVVGFKSHLGHTLGGAGAVELILSALAIRDGVVPPTANVERATIEYPLLRVTCGAEEARPIRHTLNTSLGFGGANTCVVLADPLSPVLGGEGTGSDSQVFITGVGVLVPGAIGNDAFAAMLREKRSTDRRTIDDVEFEHLINARRTRRMSPYVKLSLCAATLACQNAGIADSPELLRTAGAILGTTHGSAGYSYDYYAQIVKEGLAAANPMLFAEGVPNAAAAQLSLMLGLTGACQTIIGTTTAGLDALRLASLRIANGDAERIIVCAAEESHFTLDAAYARCSVGNGKTQSVSGAVAFVVESASAMAAREGKSIGRIDIRADGVSSASKEVESCFAAGQLFSVEPLLAIAAALLCPSAVDGPIVVRYADRTGVRSALSILPPHHVARASGT